MLGLDRLSFAVTGAAPISPDLIRWYNAMGVDMVEVFGQTESSGLATANIIGEIKHGTIGKALPDTEVRLSDQGRY